MKFKSSLLYQINDYKSGLAIYYLIILLVYTLIPLTIALAVTGVNSGNISNIFIPSMIFTFVCGVSTFLENFHFFIQNGVSRRTFFFSKLTFAVCLALFMSLVDNVFIVIIKACKAADVFIYKNLSFESIFPYIFDHKSSFGELLVIDFFSYLLIAITGFMVFLIFYKLPKAGKAIVGAGTPLLFFIILPTLFQILPNSKLLKAILKALVNLWEFIFKSPVNLCLVLFILTALFSFFTWLLMRKTVVKK